ncbi:glycoside hydrolase family 3 N-terminal domain-containing protein [Ekhidna sp.]|uniref:glycoside hydrolase family 3 protein n=1 Tax=Ekhidna sp. TaxID=2608089 RepID=UPI0032EAE063
MQKFLSLLFIVLALSGFSRTDPPKDTIDMMIGQMIMIGIGDFNLVDGDELIFDEVKTGKVGGVVLYEKNILFESPKPELALLVETLQKNSPIPLFISIDEEGGRVTRLKTRYGFPKNVSAQYLGDMNNLDSTKYYANQTASILSSFGINMNYAPVVDVNLNPRNPVIGKIERSYSEDYKEVIEQAYHVIDQHNKRGVVPVLKHFPGHGSSRSDTHLGLTDVTETWQIEEMYPYSALIDSGVVKAVMTAHIVNKSLDSSKNPATLSKRIVTGMLRDFLGFEGVIISDDMQMGAINNEYGLREAIRLSIEAGVDMLMFANNVKDYNMVTANTVHAIIKDLLFEGIVTRERIYESYKRVMKLKVEAGLCDENYYRSLKNKLRAYN